MKRWLPALALLGLSIAGCFGGDSEISSEAAAFPASTSSAESATIPTTTEISNEPRSSSNSGSLVVTVYPTITPTPELIYSTMTNLVTGGDLIWRNETMGHVDSAAVVANGIVHVGSDDD